MEAGQNEIVKMVMKIGLASSHLARQLGEGVETRPRLGCIINYPSSWGHSRSQLNGKMADVVEFVLVGMVSLQRARHCSLVQNLPVKRLQFIRSDLGLCRRCISRDYCHRSAPINPCGKSSLPRHAHARNRLSRTFGEDDNTIGQNHRTSSSPVPLLL